MKSGKEMKRYEKLRKKYSLPKFKDLQKEFQVPTEFVTEEITILSFIRGGISEHFRDLASDIEGPLTGRTFCCYYERRGFDKKELVRLFKLYKSLREKYWESRSFYFKNDNEIASWINKIYKEWTGKMKKEFEWYVTKVHKTWKELKPEETELKYVG